MSTDLSCQLSSSSWSTPGSLVVTNSSTAECVTPPWPLEEGQPALLVESSYGCSSGFPFTVYPAPEVAWVAPQVAPSYHSFHMIVQLVRSANNVTEVQLVS